MSAPSRGSFPPTLTPTSRRPGIHSNRRGHQSRQQRRAVDQPERRSHCGQRHDGRLPGPDYRLHPKPRHRPGHPDQRGQVVKDRLISDGKFTRSIIGIQMAQAIQGSARPFWVWTASAWPSHAQRPRRKSRIEDQRPDCRGGRNAGENRAGLAQSSGAEEAGPKHHHQRAARQQQQTASHQSYHRGGGSAACRRSPGVHFLRPVRARRSALRNPTMVLRPRH